MAEQPQAPVTPNPQNVSAVGLAAGQQPVQPPITPEIAKTVVDVMSHNGVCPTCGHELIKDDFFREENIWRLSGLIPAIGGFFVPDSTGIQITKETFLGVKFFIIFVGIVTFAWPVFREALSRIKPK